MEELSKHPPMYNEKMIPSISQALRAQQAPCIAFTGAGGKTTALFQLAQSMQPPVIVTATSHLGEWQAALADRHILTESADLLQELEHGVTGVVLVTGPLDGERTKPVAENVLDQLHQFCRDHSIPLLIEADGSRQRPLKGWAEHEPPVPACADQVVQVVGLSALGKPLTEEFVHRPEVFSKLSGLATGEIISPDALLQVITHPDGGLKNIPARARKVVLFNQADTDALQSAAGAMARDLLGIYEAVVIASLANQNIFAVHEPVAAILLAAGESSRYGRIKQLLDWRGEPFVRAVARRALEAGCSPVVVVTGAFAEEVGSAVQDLNVQVVYNAEWKEGQASSIRAGVQALRPPPPFPQPGIFGGHLSQTRPGMSRVDQEGLAAEFGGGREGVGSAIFLLADQPQVTVSILRALMDEHAAGLHPVVAPMVMDRRANPVLFDRSTFSDLLSLQGDVGGRAILHRHRVEYLPWHDDRLLLDVDTPEMYRRLISDETL